MKKSTSLEKLSCFLKQGCPPISLFRFAVEEPNLFRFLFQSGYAMENSLLEMIDSEELKPVLVAMQEASGMNENQMKEVFLTIALFAHGYASIIANNSLANPISKSIGINSSATFIFNLILTITLFMWINKKGLTKYYGLCSTIVPAGRFLWYIPLILFMSRNLWFGFAINFPAADTVCYILSMLCVGFLEEVIFRGFLFKALAKDNVKMAIIVSSVTFGLGHILNLFNGSGMDLIANLCQIVGAIACGFLFVIIFYRGGSLIPCVIAHSIHNALSVFANEAGLTVEKSLLFSAINMAIVVAYAFILCRTLPQKQESNG